MEDSPFNGVVYSSLPDHIGVEIVPNVLNVRVREIVGGTYGAFALSCEDQIYELSDGVLDVEACERPTICLCIVSSGSQPTQASKHTRCHVEFRHVAIWSSAVRWIDAFI